MLSKSSECWCYSDLWIERVSGHLIEPTRLSCRRCSELRVRLTDWRRPPNRSLRGRCAKWGALQRKPRGPTVHRPTSPVVSTVLRTWSVMDLLARDRDGIPHQCKRQDRSASLLHSSRLAVLCVLFKKVGRWLRTPLDLQSLFSEVLLFIT